MAYDRYDWHYNGDFPSELEEEHAGTHIGMFLAWVITRNLIGDFHLNESSDWIQKVMDRKVTGRDFLFSMCDGKFWEEDLSKEGNAFAKFYYAGEDGYGEYLSDYENALCSNTKTLYHAEDSWDGFDSLAKIIDKRFEEWKNPPKKGIFSRFFS